MNIEGSTFFITGGGSGLGAACARLFVSAGGNALLADVQEEVSQKLAGELGSRAKFVRTDVTDEASVQAALDTAAGQFGSIQGVINCAGIGAAGRVVGKEGPHDLQAFRRTIEVNLIGTFNVIRLAAAVMSKNDPTDEGERGVIINTASVAAFDGQIGQAAYSASKGGVVSMTLPIAREIARFGIRVMTIAPGVFETPMMRGLTPEYQKTLEAAVPFPPRLGRPDEYAALAGQIVENVMLNGTTIRLDGALRMSAK
ncbi:MAG: SDR family NAD(P)-dependent oxidoreductase [Planctomycetota bacterium]|nr:MAG: SDR family NAD(P)-dependent oxidoreductase [Planctomycetota bacterium]